MKVKNHMSPQPVTVTPAATVDEALHLMRQHGIRHLPVLDGAALVGLVTDNELRSAWFPSLLSEVTVADLMAPEPVTVPAEATIYQAARLLHNHRLTGLPVMEDGRVAGIITLTDVLGVLVEILGLLSETVRLDVALPPEPGLLDMVHNIISRHGGKVISLALVSAEDQRRVYSFRLEKIDLAEIVRELTAAGFAVTE
ncbi:MAG: CBS domain-containing protein [Pseudomonadota bacterium]